MQQRVIEYDANIGHLVAELDVRFSCQEVIAKSPIAYKKDAFIPESSIGYELFYECLRDQLFGGKLMQSQVDGINWLLAEWDKRQLTDTRYLAYILATTYHETAHTMQPIEEYGKGKGHRYGTTYYGRGFVQITWRDNYKRFSDRLDIDLVSQPERALEPEIAVKIIYDGMLEGLFTGKKLADYFQQDSDWYHARRIVNRLDRAEHIARIARQFWVAILMSQGQFDVAMAVPKSVSGQRFMPDSDELDELRREFLG